MMDGSDRSAAAAPPRAPPPARAACAAGRASDPASRLPRADAAVRAEVTAVTRPPLSGGTRHTAAFPRARQAPRWLRGGRGAVNSAMEPEPEDEEQAAAAAAAEAPDDSAVFAARVDVAGHEIAASSTALDVSEWKLATAQVWEVAGALAQLRCLRELVLDGVPVSGSTPRRHGDFQYGVDALDADMDLFRAVCEGLRALQGLTSLSLGGCYLGPKALALLAEVVFRDASAVLKSLVLSGNKLIQGREVQSQEEYDQYGEHIPEHAGYGTLCTSLKNTQVTELNLSECDLDATATTTLADAIKAMAVLARVSVLSNPIGADGADALIEVFEQNTKLRTLLGIEEGVTELNLSEKSVDPGQAKILAAELKACRAGAVITSINCLANKFGDEGLATLLEAVKRSSVRSLCGLVEGQKTVDFSKMNLGPIDCKIMAAEFEFRGFIAVLASLTMSGNFPAGRISKDNDGQAPWLPGKDFDEWTKLCDAVQGSQITEWNISECYLGPDAMTILSTRLSAVLTDVNMSGNPLTGKMYRGKPVDGKDISGVSALFPVMTRVIKLNVSECGLGPTSMPELAKLVRDATAAVKKVVISNNNIFSQRLKPGYSSVYEHDVDGDQSGWTALCDSLPGSPVEEFIAVDIGMGPKGVTSLAKAISAGAVAVTALNVVSNAIGEPGADSLIQVFQSNGHLQTMLGIEDGTTTLNVAGERYGAGKLDTGCAKVLAAEFSAGRRTRSITKVVLHDNRDLCDAGLAAIWDALPPHVSLAPQFQRCGLTTVPKQLFDKPDTTAIDLSENDIDHLPWELLTLTKLEELKLERNERLRTVHEINEQQGVQGVFHYLRDLYREEPTWSYSLKMILAGPSMAGKSSLLNGLVAGKADLTTPDNRTVGLDIKLLRLSDHRRRTRNGLQLQFSCYDAGGHDEYADIHNLFFSLDSLYALLCDLSKPRPEDTHKQAQIEETVSKLVQWAASIQAYAPGSVVQVVGSHADEVVARPGSSREKTAQDMCDFYLKRVKQVLDEQHKEQQRELRELEKTLPRDWESSPAIGEDSSDHARALHLRKQIHNPLQLAKRALSVSAKTLENFDALREALVDAAFNSRAFPEFGTLQPKSYQEIKDHIDVLGTTKPALTWLELRSSLAQKLQKPAQSDDFEPEPEPETVTRMPRDPAAPLSLAQALEADPDMLNRAMLFLRARGNVLYYDHVPALRDRVFIRPQWLVDVIKELVRHDLREQLELLDPRFDNVEAIRQLGQDFLESGKLRTGLLPWLWRELDPPVGQYPALMTSLMELLVQLGIVIAQPKRAGEPVWILPMRLPATAPDEVLTLSGKALTMSIQLGKVIRIRLIRQMAHKTVIRHILETH
eukprot:COSAG01_NODE_5210_length_4407_cov_569.201021_1_plen_1354_part_01